MEWTCFAFVMVYCGLLQTWYGLSPISLAFLVKLLGHYVVTADTCVAMDCGLWLILQTTTHAASVVILWLGCCGHSLVVTQMALPYCALLEYKRTCILASIWFNLSFTHQLAYTPMPYQWSLKSTFNSDLKDTFDIQLRLEQSYDRACLCRTTFNSDLNFCRRHTRTWPWLVSRTLPFTYLLSRQILYYLPGLVPKVSLWENSSYL
jgi:hypothetical protein